MYKFFNIILVSFLLTSVIGCQAVSDFKNDMPFATQSNDTTITTSVLEAMLVNENTATLTIHVETLNGVVTLSGYVKTIRQSDTSEDVARKTPGVKSVRNNIIVRK